MAFRISAHVAGVAGQVVEIKLWVMSRFGSGPSDAVDIEKPYDICMCWKGRTIVVYRKAFFRGIAKLAAKERSELSADFLEIMQSNGSPVFVRRHGVVKFCEPGATLGGEKVAPLSSISD